MAENGNGKFGGREVVIVEAVRTPIGRGHEEKGYYKDVHLRISSPGPTQSCSSAPASIRPRPGT